MKKKALYVINPISGTRGKDGVASLVVRLADRTRYDIEIIHTQYAGHAAELTRKAVTCGVDIVVAVGGDGTVNEVAGALVNTPAALGIVPCGSGNGLARHLCIPMDAARAVEIINNGEVHTLDYGTINDHPFFCTCGVGFDAFISQKFAESGKRGLLTYVENALREGLRYKPQTYEIEDAAGRLSCRAFLIACANASQYGNDALIAPHASMKDGLLDVVVMSPFNAIDAPQVALQLFNGTLPDNSHVRTFKTDTLRIHRNGAGAAHCDGEPFLTGDVIEVKLHHKAFNVVVNPDASAIKRESAGKPLLQLLPEFFDEWRQLPETLIAKTGSDIRKVNRTLFGKLKRKG